MVEEKRREEKMWERRGHAEKNRLGFISNTSKGVK